MFGGAWAAHLSRPRSQACVSYDGGQVVGCRHRRARRRHALTTQLATPRPLYGWAQPTVAADWTADMLERLPDDGWLYELVAGRVVRMPPPGPDHGRAAGNIYLALALHVRPPGRAG